MIRRPVFRPSFRVEVVHREGVYLLSERTHYLLNGELNCLIAPLLDGTRTAEDIARRLAGDARPAEVYYALNRLAAQGYVVEADGTAPPERAAFFDAIDADVEEAERRLRETTVTLVAVGETSTDGLASALAGVGIRVAEEGEFTVVLTDDYLRDGLADVNAASLHSGRPWLLAKPVGAVVWIGPIFRPGRTACWECLAERVRGNRFVEAYVQSRTGEPVVLSTSGTSLPASVATAVQLVAGETVKALASSAQGEARASLVSLDMTSLASQRHVVVRRPQCSGCGDPSARPTRAPLVLHSRKKRFTVDGGHRAVWPDETWATYEHHVSPISGAVAHVTKIELDDDSAMHVYQSRHLAPVPAGDAHALRHVLEYGCAGKGMTDSQAKASALCEALERYSAELRGGEAVRHESYEALGSSAIHPNDCMLFSRAQYRHRDEWNAGRYGHMRVAEPFDETAHIAWTPVWSLTSQELRWVPTRYCYLESAHRTSDGRAYMADSNGNAAGNTLEEAILQGFMELVERDSVAVWWYNRLSRPAVDLDSFDEPYIRALRSGYGELGREIWVLDLTTDLDIPAFVALCRLRDGPHDDIIAGSGAHFDPRIGLLRALTELNQRLVGTQSKSPQEIGRPSRVDDLLRDWAKTATLATHPYLAPDGSARRQCADYAFKETDDLLDDVLRCRDIVAQHGMEMLVLDMTRPDVELPVVKVIVPGLRHFRPRLAPGRLYQVPVKMGWLDRPLTEDALNPVPFFFP